MTSRVRSCALEFVVVALGATAVPSAHATPPKPAPTVASVTAQLDALARQGERLAEQYNAATIHLSQAKAALGTARVNALAAAHRRDDAQRQFDQLVQSEYEQGSASALSTFLDSDSAQAYIDRETYTSIAAGRATEIVDALHDATTRAVRAQQAETALVASTKRQVAALAKARSTLAARTTELTTLLDTLTAAQQRAYAARDAATPKQVRKVTATPPATTTAPAHHKHRTTTIPRSRVHAPSAKAQKAVDFALAQLGKPYVFAASGPDSYDCSGLTMAAWAHAGVHLPHLAAAQYDYGHHVSYDELEPGDLVFLYSPIGHVEIYVGHGMAVSAPQPGENVELVREADHRSDIVGATRLG